MPGEKGLKPSGREDACGIGREKKEEKVRPRREAPVAACEMRRGTTWHGGRDGIVVDAGGQHGVRPVMETRTRHCFERNEWCE